ncbi:MAG: PhlD [Streptosporangiaceae bacterium]|nr:PhlD [Streptosporangiaceae bacterium]
MRAAVRHANSLARPCAGPHDAVTFLNAEARTVFADRRERRITGRPAAAGSVGVVSASHPSRRLVEATLPAFISQPAIVLPDHKITTSEILDDIVAHHGDHPKLAVILKAVGGAGVTTRFFTRPLPEVGSGRGVEHRNHAAFAAANDLGREAARRALDAAGLRPGDVGAIITSHSSSLTVPNLDVHLIEGLGLRPNVSRIPMTTLACAGGIQALIRAADYLRARPGRPVLVVVGEELSTTYHHADTTLHSMIYKGLFGDGAGACIVSDIPLGPGLVIENNVTHTFEHVLPGSLDRYWSRLDAAGLHFDSTSKARRAAKDALPHALKWLGHWQPEWAAVHPGSEPIIDHVVTGLGLDAHAGRYSRESLAQQGNCGGASILDVLDRMYQSPPPEAAPGVAIAWGPGTTTGAVKGIWQHP